ncbi:MAG: hypothetical protein R3C05_13370 [Pirellulaceae bacterium]
MLEFLGDRSATIRGAAIQRLSNARRQSASAVVDTLRGGRLGQQLAALEVLTAWNAPVHGIDPWEPGSIDPSKSQPLIEWLRAEANRPDSTPSIPQPRLDDAAANEILKTYLRAAETDVPSAIAAAASGWRWIDSGRASAVEHRRFDRCGSSPLA